MYKLSALIIICFAMQTTKAQHMKVSIMQGIGIDLKKSDDSLFFAKNHLVTQLRVGYHIGKLGIISNTNYIMQNTDGSEKDERVPFLYTGAKRRMSDVTTIQTSLGLELCVPIIKHKAQLNFYTTYGLSFSKSDSIGLYDSIVPSYTHKVIKKSGGCLQTGLSFNYKFNKHFVAKWQNEYNTYKLPFDAFDFRKTPAIFTGMQSKQLFISSIGVQYIF
jgi:hypothetical protein